MKSFSRLLGQVAGPGDVAEVVEDVGAARGQPLGDFLLDHRRQLGEAVVAAARVLVHAELVLQRG